MLTQFPKQIIHLGHRHKSACCRSFVIFTSYNISWVVHHSISVPLDRGGFGGWNLMLIHSAEGHFVAHAPRKFVRRVWRHFDIFSALLRFSTERSTPFCDRFWRGMKKYDKFTTISNSVDTREVFWLFGWGYFKGRKLQVWDLICWRSICAQTTNLEGKS